MGTLGLNTIPSARFDETGTVRVGAGASDPYMHSFIGFQLANPLYVSIRQSAEVSSLTDSAKRLYPGIDFKLKLLDETNTRPAVAIGINSALGHKKTSSEYIALSKRINNFDFTGGVAWGQLGSAGHIKNPLRAVSSHFDSNRNYGSEETNYFNDWFTGEDIGFFAGAEYFTPIKGLSIKGEWGANDYIGERAITGFKAPAPWSVGLNYKPKDWVDISASAIGNDKLMARLSLQKNLKKWIGKPYESSNKIDVLEPRLADKKTIKEQKKPSNVFKVETSDFITKASLELHKDDNTGVSIGRAAHYLSNVSKPTAEVIELNLNNNHLKGPSLKILRKDIEKASLTHTSSPEEIWQKIKLSKQEKSKSDNKKRKDKSVKKVKLNQFDFIYKSKVSLSEDVAGFLGRDALVLETKSRLPFGFVAGVTPRLNLFDNLDRITDLRSNGFGVIRSNESDFASQRVSIDRFFASWLHSFTPSTHVAVTSGYLEEMYSGTGGEVLYRPQQKTYALGAEFWQVRKRSPYTLLSYAAEKENNTTAHLNLWYEVPKTNITSFARVGRYLGGDFGATVGLENKFDNGVKLKGFATVTDEADSNLFGGTSHLYSGVKLSLPIGNIPYVPKTSRIDFEVSPLARDSGQSLDNPMPLYELTEPLSYRQIERSWKNLLD